MPGFAFSAAVDRPQDPKSPDTDDNIFTTGAQERDENPGTQLANSTNKKTDLTRGYVASETRTVNNVANTFLYLGWVRGPSSDPTANVSFELNKSGVPVGNTPGCTPKIDPNCTWPTRSEGDLLITYDFDPAKGQEPDKVTIQLRTWNAAASAWRDPVTPSSSDVQAWVNLAEVDDKVLTTGTQTVQPRGFGEAALNLTGLGIIPTNSCAGFGSATVKSRNGGAFSSALEDFIAPLPIVVGNCKLEVRKATVPTNDSGKFNLLIDGVTKTALGGVGDGGTTRPVPVTTSDPVPIAETAVLPTVLTDYTTSLACYDRATPDEEFPVSLGSLEQSGTVTLTNGDDVVCTFTNSRLPSLTLVKKVVNDNGGTASVTDFGITTSAGELTFGDAVEVPTNTFTYTSQTITGSNPRHLHPERG